MPPAGQSPSTLHTHKGRNKWEVIVVDSLKSIALRSHSQAILGNDSVFQLKVDSSGGTACPLYFGFLQLDRPHGHEL